MISAFVMAMFFTPALTALIGHAAWWPGRADQVRPATPAAAASGAGEQAVVLDGSGRN